MRAVVVLAALLSLAFPGVSARAIELQSPIAVTLSIKSPAAPLPDLHRTTCKTDKTFGAGSPAGELAALPLIPIVDTQDEALDSLVPPSLALNVPPLAARPPPL